MACLESWEAVVAVCVHSDGPDHDGYLREAPTKHQCGDGQLFLERRTQDKKACQVQRNGDVARPRTPSIPEAELGPKSGHTRDGTPH